MGLDWLQSDVAVGLLRGDAAFCHKRVLEVAEELGLKFILVPVRIALPLPSGVCFVAVLSLAKNDRT